MKKTSERSFLVLCYTFILLALSACSLDIGLQKYKSLIDQIDDADLIPTPTFGSNNLVNTKIPAGLKPTSESAANVQKQSSGKLVIGGSTSSVGISDFILARFNANGTLDTSFGDEGLVITDVQGSQSEDSLIKIKVLSDNSIVAMGKTLVGSKQALALVKYSADGEIDTNFGDSGRLVVPIPGAVDYPDFRSLDVSPDGKILVAGAQRPTLTDISGQNPLLVQVLPAGELDTSFGTGGIVNQEVRTGTVEDYFTSAIYLSDGTIAAVGSYVETRAALMRTKWSTTGTLLRSEFDAVNGTVHYTARDVYETTAGDLFMTAAYTTSSSTAVLIKFDKNTLDKVSGFGGGAVFSPFAGSYYRALCFYSDGRILAVGENADDHAYLVRHLADGTFDSTFGSSGVAQGDLVGAYIGASSCVTNSDGSVVFAGTMASLNTPMAIDLESTDLGLVKLHSNGTVDTSFGTDGAAHVGSFVADEADQYMPVQTLQQNDGKILTLISFAGGEVSVSRHLQDGQLDLGFGVNGVAAVRFQGQGFAIMMAKMVLQKDGKIVIMGATGGQADQVVRLHPSGLTDISFGQNGSFIPPAQGDESATEFFDIAVDAQDRLVISGSIWIYDEALDEESSFLQVIKLTAQGSLQSSFGTQGVYQTTGQVARSVFAHPDGSVSLLLTDWNDDDEVLRLQTISAEGALVTQSDLATIPGNSMFQFKYAFDNSGRALTFETVNNNTLQLKRYLSSGLLDADFGGQGTVTKTVSAATFVSVISVSFDTQDNPLVATMQGSQPPPDLALHVFSADGTELPFFSGASDIVTGTAPGGGNFPVALTAGKDGALYVVTPEADGSFNINRFVHSN